MDGNSNTKTFRMCRTCMDEIIDTSTFFYLDSMQSNNESTIRQELSNCIPELDLNITPNAAICFKCADTINSFYKFKNECLRLERQIQKYIDQAHHSGGVIELAAVFRFDQLNYGNLNMQLKTEAFEIKEEFQTEDLTTSEKCTEFIKQECAPYINYNVSAVEGNPYRNDTIVQACTSQAVHNQNFRKNHKLFLNGYRCCVCNYSSKYKCLFNFHYRTHLTKKLILKHGHIQRNQIKIKNNKRKYESHKAPCKSLSKYSEFQDCSKLNIETLTIGKPFQCSVCQYGCYDKRYLNVHMRSHMVVKPFKCSVCKKQCRKKRNLVRHMRTHLKPFTCLICEYRCSQKYYLTRHMQTHTGEKPLKCSACEYQCIDKDRLKRHMQTHTGEKPFICSICDYRSTEKRTLETHMRIHTGYKPFTCSICDYRCSQKSTLDGHVRIHTGEKPFICLVCGYRCKSKGSLNIHMRIHTGERFNCSICEYQSRQKAQLNIHMQIHSGEKRFGCSICDYRSNYKSSLNAHMLIHSGDKPFTCSVCNQQFRQKGQLTRHMQIHVK